MAREMIQVRNLFKTFVHRSEDGESRVQVLFEDFSFSQHEGEIVTFFGPNGSGKTSLLRILLGLEKADQGSVLVNGLPPGSLQTATAFVPQGSDLFDWMTVVENVEFGLKVRGIPPKVRRDKALEFLELVRLRGHEHKYPHQLSGGMRQRCAIARALVIEPALLLLDEPTAALDLAVRQELHDLLLRIAETRHLTVCLVTHDPEEAIFLSSRVVVLGSQPTRTVAELRVDLPHPRRREIRFEPNFKAYLETITNIYKNQQT